MIQLEILSGKQAGTAQVVRCFPFRVGRGPDNDLRLEDDGVWDRHFDISFDSANGFCLKTGAQAIIAINGQQIPEALLRNGDLIELGAAKLRFFLSPPVQLSLRARETLTWVALGVLALMQVALIYWMLE